MNCVDCQELMLEADPEALTGIGDERVAVHIRSCDACRDLATAMMNQLTIARTMYSRLEPAVQAPQFPVRSIRRRAAWVVASLAAAAAILIAVIPRRPAQVEQHLGQRNIEPDTATSTIAVEVPDGKSAIVFETSNPQVSVVWIY